MKVFGLPSNSYVKIANSSDFYTLESLFFARLAEISGIRWCEITLHPTMEAWVSGRNHLSAKEAVLRGSKVRIFPFPQCPDGEVANTSVCKTDIRRFESCSRLEHHGSVAQR